MRDKLESIIERYNSIQDQMAESEIISNPDKLKDLAKEYKQLEPVVLTGKEYIKILDQIILNLKNLYEDKWKLINKINTSISIPIKISVKNSNFIISEKLENILNQSDFVYEYEIEKISSEDIIYKITYNNNPEKFLNTLKVNDININSSSNIWNIE